MYTTATKESSKITHARLAEICKAVKIPVVAIGGLNAGNAAACIEAGCAGVAVVQAIFGAEDPSLAASELRDVVETTLHQRQ